MSLVLHLVTLFWTVFAIVLLARHRLAAAMHPLLHVAVAHIVYFAVPPDTAVLQVGFLHLLTAIVLVAGFYSVSSRSRLRLTGPRSLLMDNSAVKLAVIWSGVAIALAVPIAAVLSGARPFDVLTGFYTDRARLPVHPAVAVLIRATKRIPFIAIVLGRIWVNLSPSIAVRWSWRILFLVQLSLAFASGIRSAVVFVVAFVVLGDVYAKFVLQVQLPLIERVRQKTAYFLLGTVTVLTVAFLTLFRHTTFYDPRQMVAGALAAMQSGSLSGAAGSAGLQKLNRFAAFCVTHYVGDGQYGQGLYAQVANVVPRYLWQDKPYGFGKTLAHDAMGTPYNHPNSVAAGIGGEAIYNGGWPGVVVLGYLFGVFFGLLYRGAINLRDPSMVACLLVYVGWATGICRGDWLSSINQITYQVGAYILLMGVMRMGLGRPIRIIVPRGGSAEPPEQAVGAIGNNRALLPTLSR